MTTQAAPGEHRRSELLWDFTRFTWARRILSLAGFGLVYCVLVLLGLELRESSQQLTILWPAAGLLFMALWLSPRRNWPWLLGVQIAAEIALAAVRDDHFSLSSYAIFPVANSIDATMGALVAQKLIEAPEIPRISQVLQFIAAVALGSAASAVLGALGVTSSEAASTCGSGSSGGRGIGWDLCASRRWCWGGPCAGERPP